MSPRITVGLQDRSDSAEVKSLILVDRLDGDPALRRSLRMVELLLSDLLPRLLAEIRQWAKLRRVTAPEAAVELLRLGLHPVRDLAQEMHADVYITAKAPRH